MDLFHKLNLSFRHKLPVLRQTQAAECGLTCVGMIAGFYGHHIDMVSLRQRFPSSLKGSTLANVMSFAQNLGMGCRAVRLELDELDKLSLPCVLHWDMNHFVVLKGFAKNKIIIHDPARGVRKVPMDEVSTSFTGVALELYPAATFEKKDEKKSISMFNLIRNVSGIGSAFTQVALLSLALEFFGIITPFYMQWVIDQVLVSADRDLLTLLGVAFICITLFQNLISALRSWVTTWFSSMLSVQWSSNLCAHLLGLPLNYFEERHVGDILSRFGSIANIQSTLTGRFISSIFDGVMAIVTLGVIFTYNASLTFVVIGLFLLYALIRWISFEPFRQANEDQLLASAVVQSQLLESIRGVQAIKLNNKQDLRVSTYTNETVESTNKGITTQKLSIGFSTLQGTISGVGKVVLIWLAAAQVLDGNFTSGMLVAFISFSDQFISRSAGLINALIEFKMLRLHGERLSDIVLSEKEQNMESNVALAEDKGPVRLDISALSFRYSATDADIFCGFNLSINAGESVAIIGPSGQGKTTLAKLLLGLLKPDAGSICIDGVDHTKLGMTHYRDLIGSVMQNDILFAGSIMDNISFFDASLDKVQVEKAARVAQIHGDIMAMPMGYNSMVGDMGSSLSGGQVQRVILARALYRQPRVLILDEATSHLDVARESAINDAIKHMNITRIMIAHRPETILSADRIIQISRDGITELSKADFITLITASPSVPEAI
ncbi:peptidase domain-containing ABC transporter [Rahnella victoriana]|jgi:ATP-binding cassette subfamily B protein RaxB|uniref:peptidase domain-containing ABC transporter n=1 Tax=Rahnella victoriana TaxID=1510570 RepID=UPI000BB199C0|nr:peptidase domain-containing ABC transporter [Rahnella victoriana]PBI80237.1 ABC transporter [Rahnella victoriana]UHM89182.1 peptidase domain-containing ABC transporter [Rahnella victoriana]VTQ58567.1 leukotoxin translocation ATP-binding protein LktB [Campylobacter jejuni]